MMNYIATGSTNFANVSFITTRLQFRIDLRNDIPGTLDFRTIYTEMSYLQERRCSRIPHLSLVIYIPEINTCSCLPLKLLNI